MTNFIKVQGGTYYLPLEHINVGLYAHKNEGVLIDSGYTEADANLIAELLSNKKIKLKAIINTHAHPENCGGSSYLKKLTQCQVMVTRPELLIMESPTRSNYILPADSQLAVTTEPVAKAKPSIPIPDSEEEDDEEQEKAEQEEKKEEKKPETTFILKEEDIKKALVRPLSCRIDSVLIPDQQITVGGKKIKILDLSGHTLGQVGVKTPDGVLFISDALSSMEHLALNPIPHLESLVQYKKTLDYLLNVGETHFVPARGKPMEFSIATEVLYNQQQIKMIEDALLLHLHIPRTKEELVALIFATFDLAETIPNFYSVSATIMAFLNGLKKLKKITIIHERGQTRWFVK